MLITKGVNSVDLCPFNCLASHTFGALNKWEWEAERGGLLSLPPDSMGPWLNYSQSLPLCRKLTLMTMIQRCRVCQRLSSVAAVELRIQWWDGKCPEAARAFQAVIWGMTVALPLAGAWAYHASLLVNFMNYPIPFDTFIFLFTLTIISYYWHQDFCLSQWMWLTRHDEHVENQDHCQ